MHKFESTSINNYNEFHYAQFKAKKDVSLTTTGKVSLTTTGKVSMMGMWNLYIFSFQLIKNFNKKSFYKLEI